MKVIFQIDKLRVRTVDRKNDFLTLHSTTLSHMISGQYSNLFGNGIEKLTRVGQFKRVPHRSVDNNTRWYKLRTTRWIF